jgi:acyl transferase domain-containing protein
MEPAYVAGTGAGEYAAACVAGMIGLADGLRLADAFQTLMDSLPPGSGAPSLPVGSVLEAFDRATLKIAIAPPRIAFASSVGGEIMGSDAVEPQYWRRQVRASFRSSEAISVLHARGARVFLVAGPEWSEAATVSTAFPEPTLVLNSLQTGESDWSAMLKSLKTLYLAGVCVDWVGFDRDYARSKIEAPTYPFQRQDLRPAGLGAP